MGRDECGACGSGCHCTKFPVFTEWKTCDERSLRLATTHILEELRRVQKMQAARMRAVEQENNDLKANVKAIMRCLIKVGTRVTTRNEGDGKVTQIIRTDDKAIVQFKDG